MQISNCVALITSAANGITVNAVAPGPVDSATTTNFPDALKRLIPAGRMGPPLISRLR